MIVFGITGLVLFIFGFHLAIKYDCDDYTKLKKEQTLGALGLFFLFIGMLLLIITTFLIIGGFNNG